MFSRRTLLALFTSSCVASALYRKYVYKRYSLERVTFREAFDLILDGDFHTLVNICDIHTYRTPLNMKAFKAMRKNNYDKLKHYITLLDTNEKEELLDLCVRGFGNTTSFE